MTAQMSYAMVQINPFQVLQTYFPTSLPDPVIWPDGAVTHATSAGYVRENWALAPIVYAPQQPNRFYALSASTPTFDGSTVTYAQTWSPVPLAAAQAQLSQQIDVTAENIRQQFITAGSGQAMVYQQKLAEATALQNWIAANPGQTPTASLYPLLSCSVGVEQNASGTAACTSVTDAMTLVLNAAAKWAARSAQIETARLTAKNNVMAAQTVDAAIAAAAVNWP